MGFRLWSLFTRVLGKPIHSVIRIEKDCPLMSSIKVRVVAYL